MIPKNVKTHLQAAGMRAHQNAMHQSRGNVRSSNNIIRHSSARQVDEMGAAQARTVDKILSLPK